MLRRALECMRRGRRHWFAVFVAAAIVVNLAQFAAIEGATRHNYSALQRYETHDLFDIAIGRDNSARERVAPYVYFGRLFPGSVVILPQAGLDIWFDAEPSLASFGATAALERADYDARDLVDLEAIANHRMPAASFAPTRGSTLRVVDGRVGYYAAALGAGRFVVVTPDGPPQRQRFVAFVDMALLDSQTRSALGAQ